MSDIKETGQFEQDADVIMALCWPVKLDPTAPKDKFQFFILKNRNRGCNQQNVVCRFLPDRQKIIESLPEISPEWQANAARRQM